MKRRGFTLIEMIAVISIISIMSSIAVINYRSIAERGRVNGLASDLARSMANGRVRAMTMSCRIGVQINGPTYNAAGAPVGAANKGPAIMVYRKNVCDPAAVTNGWFEAGDHVLSTMPFEELSADITVPGVLVGNLDNDAVAVTWSMVGGVLTREVFLDSGSSGTFVLVGTVAGAPISFDVSGKSGTGITNAAHVPDRGAPYLP